MDKRLSDPTFRAPTAAETAAVEAARALIAARKQDGRHHVASSLIGDGRVFTALNLQCTLPQAARCAEPGALAMALSAASPPATLDFIAAVNRRGEVIPPCGVCRELLMDFAPDIDVAVPDGRGFAVTPLSTLYPVPYKAGQRASDR